MFDSLERIWIPSALMLSTYLGQILSLSILCLCFDYLIGWCFVYLGEPFSLSVLAFWRLALLLLSPSFAVPSVSSASVGDLLLRARRLAFSFSIQFSI